MIKKEFEKKVADVAGLSDAQAKAAIHAFVEVVTDLLADNDKLTLQGFGTFETRERKARVGYNPKTGETIEIEASVTPAFKASTTLKNAVKGK